PAPGTTMAQLDTQARALIAGADTFFIATAHPDALHSDDPIAGVDVSHRGGPAGFVRVQDASTLLVPDYVGNSFFNTLGNLQLEPRCALLFIDFGSGERLHVQAHGDVLWDAAQRDAFPGALRVLRLVVSEATRVVGGLPLQWLPA
ncbi:MAG TPA: pyridoxamine 5'-phosphate oxidase family protein, partial [Ramlibacter sp.]|nr:pyridoxamine 5'-phosphate oxidase family protein [Ramlibacter sp.]